MQPAAVPPIPAFDVRPRRSAFLGWNYLDGYRRYWSGPEDSIGIVGPPRYGKTTGLIIPTVLWWDGPIVCTSTRADILSFTGDHRRALAAPFGGEVLGYDPFGDSLPGRSIRWSPLAGCRAPAICFRRVAAMTAVAGQGLSEGEHWRAGAAGILRGYFHAAALADRPLADVRRWLARQDVREPVAILRTSPTPAAMWADDLEAVRLLGDRERGSFYSVARNTLEATAEPAVLASCATSDLDVDRFLSSRSSLFLVSPSHQQQAVAPLMAGLVDSIAQRAAELAATRDTGRLEPPLLLALDEIANIAPLHSLPSLVSEGGGRGIVTLWAAQSLAQLRARYGTEQQAAILAATTAKLVFGGLSNSQDLANISGWAGERLESSATDGAATDDAPWVRVAVLSQRSTATGGGPRGRAHPRARRPERLHPAGAVVTGQSSPPPWVWDGLSADEFRARWQNLVAWVQWLEDAYTPWVVLPPCWPAHEGLRSELILFSSWHRWLMTHERDPVAGLRWHGELRRAADAWRDLATCDHRAPGAEQERVRAAERARRDSFVAQAMACQRED